MLFNGFHSLLVVLAKILLVAMVLIISVNVFLRYVMNSGLAWSEEIALLLVVWFAFIAMAMGVRQNLHIHLSILPDNLPDRLEFLLRKLRSIVILFSSTIFLYYGWILTRFTLRSILPATGIPAGVLYVIVPIAAVPMMYDAAAGLFGFGPEEGNTEGKEGGHA